MANVKDLSDKLDALNTAQDNERTEALGLFKGLKDQIQALKDQVAQGTGITEADLQPIADRLDAAITKTQATVDAADVA